MSNAITLIFYVLGVVAFYALLRERDMDNLNVKNRAARRSVVYAYTRRNRLNNSITALTSWIGIAILVISVMIGVFTDYNWKRPVKW